MKKNIVIRVDANKKIGLGHLLRVKGFIYKNMKNYNKFIVLTKGDKKILDEVLNNKKKIKTFLLTKKSSKETDKIYEIVKKFKSKILFSDISYDHYLKSNNILKNYHTYFKKKKNLTVSIDDPRQYLNSNLSVIPYPIKKSFLNLDKNTKVLCGIKYISFNNDIIKKKKNIKKRIKNLLIALGGFDSKNQSLKILKIILTQKFKFNIKVLSNKNNNKNLLLISKKKKNIELVSKIQNIDNLLNWSDLVLIGEGNLRFEAAVKGVPAIFFNNIDNSKKNNYLINNFLRLKTSLFLEYKKLNKKKFLKLLDILKDKNFRKKQSLNGFKLFDLNGAERINFEITKLYNKLFFKA